MVEDEKEKTEKDSEDCQWPCPDKAKVWFNGHTTNEKWTDCAAKERTGVNKLVMRMRKESG